MTKIVLTIPANLDFSALGLARRADTGGISFSWAPIEAICAANGIDVALFRAADEDNIAGLIITWYAEHRARGGAPDAVAEELVAEVLAEDQRGGGISHAPGRA